MRRNDMRQRVRKGMLVILVGGLAGCSAAGSPDEQAALPESQLEATGESLAGPEVRIADQMPVWGDYEEALFRIMAAEVSAHRGNYMVAAEHYLEAARRADDSSVASRAVRVAIFAQYLEGALEAAELWVERDPEDLEARQILGVLLIADGRAEEAVAHLEEVIAAHQDVGSAFEEIARILAQEGQDTESALAALEELAEAREDAVGYTTLARFALSAGDLERAVTAAEQADERAQSRASAELLTGILIRARGAESAYRYMAERLAEHPDEPRLHRVQAQILSELERYDEAYEHFVWLEENAEPDPEVTFSAGLLALEQGRFDAAERRLEQLLDDDDWSHEAHYYYAQAAEQRGEPGQAVERYRAVGEGRYEADARLREGVMLAEVVDLEAARAHLRKWGRRYSDERAEFYQAEAELLRDRGLYDEALAVYDEALDRLGEHQDLLYARALVAEQAGQVDEVESDLRQILEQDPDHAHALNALGYMLADRTDRYEEAERYISRALELMPDSYYVLDSMGWVKYRQGKLDEALEYLRRAWELSDGDPEVAAHLGEVLWEKGRRDEARRIWEAAREQTPDHELLLETVERFDN